MCGLGFMFEMCVFFFYVILVCKVVLKRLFEELIELLLIGVMMYVLMDVTLFESVFIL